MTERVIVSMDVCAWKWHKERVTEWDTCTSTYTHTQTYAHIHAYASHIFAYSDSVCRIYFKLNAIDTKTVSSVRLLIQIQSTVIRKFSRLPCGTSFKCSLNNFKYDLNKINSRLNWIRQSRTTDKIDRSRTNWRKNFWCFFREFYYICTKFWTKQ